MGLYQLNKEQIFWKVVNYIQECSDTRITNEAGITTHTGMRMNENYCIVFGHDTGEIQIFDNEKEITSFNENSEILYSFALIFEDLITDQINKKAPQTAGTECEDVENTSLEARICQLEIELKKEKAKIAYIQGLIDGIITSDTI